MGWGQRACLHTVAQTVCLLCAHPPPSPAKQKWLWSELGDQLISLGWSILGLEKEEERGQWVGRGQDEAEMFWRGSGVGEPGKQVGKGQRGEWGRLKCLLIQNLHEWQSQSFPARWDIQQIFVHSESEVGFFLTWGHRDGRGHLLSAAGVVSCNRLKSWILELDHLGSDVSFTMP